MAKLRRFRLVGSTHVDNTEEGQTRYKKGDVIESTEDLTQKFLNKFEEVKASEAPPVTKRKAVPRDGTPPEDLEDEEVAHPLKPAKAVEDNEVDRANLDYEDNQEDADKGEKSKKAAKAKDHKRAEKGKKAKVETELEEDDEEDTDDEEEEDGGSEFGDDVTDKYPKAKEADLKVFFNKDEKDFTIVDADEPDTPLNDHAIADKKGVAKFLGSYLKKKS